MDLKADRLLSKLAQRLAGHDIRGAQLDGVYADAITSLPDNKAKLKEYLRLNSVPLKKKLHRYFEDECNKQQQCPPIDRVPTFVQQILTHKNDPGKLNKITEGKIQSLEKTLSTQVLVKQLCKTVISFKSATVLQSVGYSLYRMFDKNLEDLLEGKLQSELNELKDTILKVAFMIRNSSLYLSNMGEKCCSDTVPKLPHILAALYSLYIDIHLILARSETEEKQILEMGNNLVAALVLQGAKSENLVESIIQLSSTQTKNAHILLSPLYKHIFLNKSHQKYFTVPQYLQYLASFHQSCTLLKPHDPELLSSIRSAVLNIRCSKSFYKWVVNRKGGADLLDLTPILAISESQFITEYFVKEADVEIVDDFLDLCHAEMEIQSKPNVENEPDGKPHEGLGFFLDTIPTNVDDASGSDSPPVENVDEENSDEDLLKETAYLVASDIDGAERMPKKRKTKRRSISAKKSNIQSKKRKTQCENILSTIDEDLVPDDFINAVANVKQSARRKLRSDSESSTGSHGYMTRSKKSAV
ncbi:unnamed protein product [Clavelina lepadiformis]|uniref:Uncharacterized protein n=1 Tax=Clavelina lepadiformis TaxID=159417 RepID=A0ABP0FD50_CLALP